MASRSDNKQKLTMKRLLSNTLMNFANECSDLWWNCWNENEQQLETWFSFWSFLLVLIDLAATKEPQLGILLRFVFVWNKFEHEFSKTHIFLYSEFYWILLAVIVPWIETRNQVSWDAWFSCPHYWWVMTLSNIPHWWWVSFIDAESSNNYTNLGASMTF